MCLETKKELKIEQQRPDEMKSELNIFKIYKDTWQGKITNGQLVKNTSKKDCVNVESALEADLKSVKVNITKGQMIKKW